MIIISNVLVMNGGTTFLLRFCREWARQGRKIAVLVLFREYEDALLEELRLHADVVCLWDYVAPLGRKLPSRLHMFAPVRWRALMGVLAPYADHIHIMGLFGLIFAHRLKPHAAQAPISAGVYHQNEFLFEPSGSLLEAKASRLFAELPAENVVFVNESSLKNYNLFFQKDFGKSTVVPVGIDPIPPSTVRSNVTPFRIVSVGNLVPFKTYNEHIIRIVAAIAGQWPQVRYDIYGDGEEDGRLKALASDLQVADKVRFHGQLAYEAFPAAVASAALFVGSGTALLEAAALGVPALVGIESIPVPETYGFLSDVRGFSYNENSDEVEKVPMAPLVIRVLSDAAYNEAVGEACRKKAATFSVTATVAGFAEMLDKARPIPGRFTGIDLALVTISMIRISILHMLGLDRRFASRRNQSFTAQPR
jgi:1,2-diacylglycerol 3-alpha-glucosyltransferase